MRAILSLRAPDVIAPESIAEILGLKSSIRSISELEAAISAGLPKRSLERLAERLYLDRGTASEIRENGPRSKLSL
jgi:hypothetical protein